MGGDTFDRPAHRCVTTKDMSDYAPHPYGGGMVHKTATVAENAYVTGQVEAGVVIKKGCCVAGRICQDAQLGIGVKIPSMGVVSQGVHIPDHTPLKTVQQQYLCDPMA